MYRSLPPDVVTGDSAVRLSMLGFVSVLFFFFSVTCSSCIHLFKLYLLPILFCPHIYDRCEVMQRGSEVVGFASSQRSRHRTRYSA